MLDMSSLAIPVPDCRETPLRASLSVLSVHQYPWRLRPHSSQLGWVQLSDAFRGSVEPEKQRKDVISVLEPCPEHPARGRLCVTAQPSE